MATGGRRPGGVLASFVGSISWHVGDEQTVGRERILPTGTVSAMVNLDEDEFRTYDEHGRMRRTRGAVLIGPSSGYTVIDTAEQRALVTVQFRLGGVAPFFGAPPFATRDEMIELDELWGFRAQVGLTPKRFARVRRLQRLVGRVHGKAAVDWAEAAATHGYFDQAHLINDFRELTGLTPAAYAATVGPERNHVPLTG